LKDALTAHRAVPRRWRGSERRDGFFGARLAGTGCGAGPSRKKRAARDGSRAAQSMIAIIASADVARLRVAAA